MSTTNEMVYEISRQRELLTKMLIEFPDIEFYSRNCFWNFQTVNITHEIAYGISRQ